MKEFDLRKMGLVGALLAMLCSCSSGSEQKQNTEEQDSSTEQSAPCSDDDDEDADVCDHQEIEFHTKDDVVQPQVSQQPPALKREEVPAAPEKTAAESALPEVVSAEIPVSSSAADTELSKEGSSTASKRLQELVKKSDIKTELLEALAGHEDAKESPQ